MRLRPVIVTPRIVQSGRQPRTWLWGVLLALVVVLVWQAFDYGRRSGGFDVEVHQQLEQKLRNRVDQLRQERDRLRVQQARWQRAAQIDQAAVAAVQADLKNLQQERAELRQHVALLKSLVSGEATTLQLGAVKLRRLKTAGYFAFSFSLAKRALGGGGVSGRVDIEVMGKQNDKPVTLGVDDLKIDKAQLRLRFQTYQRVDGTLALPAGFVPEQWQIGIQTSGKNLKGFKKVFPWNPL